MCDALESNRAEIGPIELATKCSGKIKKGVSVCLVTLDKVARGLVLHVLSYCVRVSAHAASRVLGCCKRVADAHAALCMVGYYATVTARTMSHSTLGILSHFGCCIQDAAAAAMATPPKFPEAKSRGLVDLLLLFSFPKGKVKRVLFCLGCARQPKQMLQVGFLPVIGSSMA